MPPSRRQYLWKSILWAGPGLITAGLVIGGIQQDTSPLAIALVSLGLVLTIVGVSVWGGLLQSLFQHRSTQAGTDAVIAILSLLVILGLLNSMALKYPVRWDLTETRLFTLAPQTQKLVKGLTQPMKIWIFEANQNPTDRELLNNYRRLSDEFTYSYVDPQIEIGLADRFDVQVVGEVYLEYGGKQQLIQTLREGEVLSEVQLTNGIEKILRDRQPQIYFLQGHGELPLEPIEGGLYQAITGLEEKGYGVFPLDLTEAGDVPSDASVVIIASPQQSLLPGEVETIADYLDREGSVMALLDPETFSGLEPLLADWGIALDGRLAIDASGVGANADLGPATPVVTDYGTHPITLDFQNRISFYPLAQAIVVDEDIKDETITVTPLVLTPTASWAESNLSSDTLEFDPDEDLEGPLTIAVAATRSLDADEELDKSDAEEQVLETDDETASPDELESSESDDDEVSETEHNADEADAIEEDNDSVAEFSGPEARLIVFGNATFASNGWFEQQLNGDVFLNSVKWLANESEDLLSIRPKALTDRRINLAPAQAALLTWLAIVVFPLIGFLSAGWLWWRGR
ncbi:MAG: ABC transporter [Spirulina sp. SIO3F2]|nr:ABC transporter [Spirulina sp. SIO3F2]